MKTITVNKTDLMHDLSIFPNFSASGSIKGMKKNYYGNDALLLKSGSYIYKVTQEVYDFYNKIPLMYKGYILKRCSNGKISGYSYRTDYFINPLYDTFKQIKLIIDNLKN